MFVDSILRGRDGREVRVRAVVDTGAEVNLVRKGLLAQDQLSVVKDPVALSGVNQGRISGGQLEFVGRILMEGLESESKKSLTLSMSFRAVEVVMDADCILSYPWLADHYIDVYPKRHGILIHGLETQAWVPAMKLGRQGGKVGKGKRSVVQVVRDAQKASRQEEVALTGEQDEDYAVRREFFWEFTRRLKLAPTRDCFAQSSTSQCEGCYTPAQDALKQDWDPEEVLWVNPPWRIWPEVAEKLMVSGNAAICVLPAWSKPWVHKILCAATKRLYVEAGTRLFVKEGKKQASTLWGVWVVRLDKGVRRQVDLNQAYERVTFFPRWRRSQAIKEGFGLDPQRLEAVIGQVVRDAEDGQASEGPESSQVGEETVGVQPADFKPGKRMLDLFSGTGSVGDAFRREGYDVVSVDNNPKYQPTIVADILAWDYKSAYPVRYFDVVFACPPCTQYSQAKTTGERDLDGADALVERALEIIRYFGPRLWFLENPRDGLLKTRQCVKDIPSVDVDYCQFSAWGYRKPTRIWGGEHIKDVRPRVCDPETCPNMVERPNGHKGHRERLGGNDMRATRDDKYRVPEDLVRYLCGWFDPEVLNQVEHCLERMQIDAGEGTHVVEPADKEAAQMRQEVARELMRQGDHVHYINSVVVADQPVEGDQVAALRQQILEKYKDSVFDTRPRGQPPVRGPEWIGEAHIELKPGANPVKQKMYQMHGPRADAWTRLVDELLEEGKLEDGMSPWSSPSFPVPKKKPGEYRLVVDYRALNEVTVTDAHPLPRIEDILHVQGKFFIWSVLDMKNGYHQVPLAKACRHLTCMTTPRGPKQWTVLVMGLKNGGAIFQRMMEWVLRDLPGVSVYVDDVIVGSSGSSLEELLANHAQDLARVMDRLKEHQLVVDPAKAKLFVREVEFCGHVLREGKRWPAPGKLLSIQKWELPQTVTQLRGFLGLTNYYSSYVHHYAEWAGPLTSKLQLNRHDGKKGSKKVLSWKQEEIEAFEKLKKALAEKLQVFRVDPDKPFVLRCDASAGAIGAVLEQTRTAPDGTVEMVPVGFFSRKLAKGQRNWAIREKETYAVVMALRKWAGWIGLQPVLITTDHRTLEDWVHEKMDTPSGPAGRRARWHETLSKFDLTVQYVPGKDNVVADAMSRFAYPASRAFQDTSSHGDEESRLEVKQIIAEELKAGRVVGLICRQVDGYPMVRTTGVLAVGGTVSKWRELPEARVCVITRSGRRVEESDSDDMGSESRGVQTGSRPKGRSRGIAPSMPGPQPEVQPAPTVAVPRAAPRSTRGRGYVRLGTPQVGRRTEEDEGVASQPSSIPQVREYLRRRRDAAGNFIGGWEMVPQPVGPPDTQEEARQVGRGRQEQRGEDQEVIEFSGGGEDEAVSSNSVPMGLPELAEEPTEEVGIHEEWDRDYADSPWWSENWRATQESGAEWPAGIRLQGNRMLWQNKICVPESQAEHVMREFHRSMGHTGAAKLAREVDRRYAMPGGWTVISNQAKAVCQACVTCQACSQPYWEVAEPWVPTPIPPYLMSSVCLDIFWQGPAQFEGVEYDSFLLCVDRLSGWIMAKPCTKVGLTAEKAAHLMMDGGWDVFGIPAIITSDQGPQFVGQWWRTMCARLGIRQSFSQAYRPQANGRAEVAGKTIQDLLRKLSVEEGINWVEALPRALRIYHDIPGESGYSPFQIVFGRERLLGGPARPVDRECESAKEFFGRMAEMDEKIARHLNQLHADKAYRTNRTLIRSEPYQVGDWVWVIRTRSSQVTKADSRWVGPVPVVRRVGESSYEVEITPGVMRDVHADQLKPFVTGEVVPLHHFRPASHARGTADDGWKVEAILGHRKVGGRWQFLTRWEGAEPGSETWEPVDRFVRRYSRELPEYCREKGVALDLAQCLGSTPPGGW